MTSASKQPNVAPKHQLDSTVANITYREQIEGGCNLRHYNTSRPCITCCTFPDSRNKVQTLMPV